MPGDRRRRSSSRRRSSGASPRSARSSAAWATRSCARAIVLPQAAFERWAARQQRRRGGRAAGSTRGRFARRAAGCHAGQGRHDGTISPGSRRPRLPGERRGVDPPVAAVGRDRPFEVSQLSRPARSTRSCSIWRVTQGPRRRTAASTALRRTTPRACSRPRRRVWMTGAFFGSASGSSSGCARSLGRADRRLWPVIVGRRADDGADRLPRRARRRSTTGSRTRSGADAARGPLRARRLELARLLPRQHRPQGDRDPVRRDDDRLLPRSAACSRCSSAPSSPSPVRSSSTRRPTTRCSRSTRR